MESGAWALTTEKSMIWQKKILIQFHYIDEIFDSLGGPKIFTTLDLFSGFHQIFNGWRKGNVEVITFTTMFGNYQFKIMPFGLTGAPSTFQKKKWIKFYFLLLVNLFTYLLMMFWSIQKVSKNI